MNADAVVRERFPDLDPEGGPGAARRWRRLVRLAEVAQEYRKAKDRGEKAPATVIAEKRGVAVGTVHVWLSHAKKEGFDVPTRRANELGPVGERVAENLKRLRAVQRVTTEQLAKRVSGLGRPMYGTTITKIEKLWRRVDVDDLAALAAALSVTPAQLLEPPTDCATCHGTPPPGFACTECHTTTKETPS